MKVICIDATPRHFGKILTEGQTYTVTQEITINGDEGYLLSEVQTPLHPFVGFKKRRFIPLSSIDETELVKERLTTVNQ